MAKAIGFAANFTAISILLTALATTLMAAPPCDPPRASVPAIGAHLDGSALALISGATLSSRGRKL